MNKIDDYRSLLEWYQKVSTRGPKLEGRPSGFSTRGMTAEHFGTRLNQIIVSG